MKIISARNPVRTANGGVDILATFKATGEIPFHATASDTESHGRELYARAMNGEFGQVVPYTAPVVSLEDAKDAKLVRINDAKNVALDGGFVHDGVLFDSDLKARAAYLELDAELRGDPAYTTGWKASSGVWVQMDKALYDALRVSYKAHISACFAWQAAREQEVAAALALENEAEARAALLAISETM